jgi:chemotaxis protein CheD
MADMKVSKDTDVELITYALGSCIAVIVYEPTLKIGGMIHYMLPASTVAQAKAEAKPAMFADTGIPLLFHESYKLGCKKENMIVKIAGGGHLYDDKGIFNIGKRNYTVLRKIFWKTGVIITSEDVGGSKSRTVRLSIATGRVTVKADGEDWDL